MFKLAQLMLSYIVYDIGDKEAIAEIEGMREQRRDEAEAKNAKVNEVRQQIAAQELAVL